MAFTGGIVRNGSGLLPSGHRFGTIELSKLAYGKCRLILFTRLFVSIISAIKDVLRPVVYSVPNRIQKFKRTKELKTSRPKISKERLVDDLSSLPVRSGAIVLVHSSLKALGYVEDGPSAVVDALMEAFVTKNSGTVMLPTYSIDGTMHQTLLSGRVFDIASTPSNLGAIPEAFRQHLSALRSIHPTHSFAAIGRDAQWLVEDHDTCGTSFGRGSPMAKMLESESYLLGLGTNLGNVTFYHCLEEIEDDFPINVFTADSPVTVECRGYDGQVHRLAIRAHDSTVSRTRIDRPENQEIRSFFTQWFEHHAAMKWYQVGQAKVWLIEAGQLYGEAKRLMRSGITIYSTKSDILEFERRTSGQGAQ